MANRVPHDIDYKRVNKFDYLNDKILYSSGILSAAIIFIDNLNFMDVKTQDILMTWFNGALGVFALGYFVLDIVRNYLFQMAEEHRRSDFVDNSLGTTIATKNSDGYFSNDTLQEGTEKMGVNCFENSFFTYNITSAMISKAMIKSVLIVLLILGVAFFANPKILTAIVQIALPLTIIGNTIRLLLFNRRIKDIFQSFSTTFSTASGNDKERMLIYYVLKYEAALAWGAISLDSETFNKLNPKLSQEWEDLKAKLSIG